MRYLILVLASVAAWGQSSLFSSIGEPMAFPSSMPSIAANSGAQTICTLNGAAIKCSQCGYAVIPSMTSKTVSNLHFMFGGVTKTGGTTLRVGLQSPSTTTGPVIQPDGTFLSSGNAFSGISNASITASTWFRSGTVGGSLLMSPGTSYCLVVEVDSYAGSDSFQIRGANMRVLGAGQAASYNGSDWSTGTLQSLFHLIEFDDGTFGSIGPALPFNALGTATTFNTGSASDEIGTVITPNVSLGVIGMCAENPYSTSGGDADFVLYSGSTAIATASIDAQRFLATSSSWQFCAMFSSRISLSSGSTYRAVIKPTTANNVRILSSTASSSGYFSVFGGGTNMSYTSRADAGSWTDVATSRAHVWLLVDQAGSVSSVGAGAYVVAQ